MQALHIGALSVAAFVVLTAIRDVFLNGFFQSGSMLFAAFTGAAIAVVAGVLGDLGLRRGAGLAALAEAPRAWLRVNLCTGFAWLAYFGSLKWLEPALALTLYMGARPIVALAAGAPGSRRELVLQLGVVAAMAWLVGVAVAGAGGFQPDDPLAALGAAGLAILGGALMAGTVAYSRELNDAGVSPSAAMASRLLLLLPMTLVIAFAIGDFGRWSPLFTRENAVVAFLMVVPLVVYHAAIARLTPFAVNVGTALGPVLVLAVQAIEGRIAWSAASAAGVAAYAALTLLAAFVRAR